MTPALFTIGQRMLAARRRRRIRRTTLAERLGVAVPVLRAWETDAALPTEPEVEMTARALGVETHWLLSGEHSHACADVAPDDVPPMRLASAAAPGTGRLASWLARRDAPEVRAACARALIGRGVAERLRQLRRIAGLQQRDVAYVLDVGAERVSMWECGRVEPDDFRLGQFAELYAVTLAGLRYGVGDSAPLGRDWRLEAR